MRRLIFGATAILLLSILLAVDRVDFLFPPADPKEEGRSLETLPIAGAVGPESFAFDPLGGGPYTGVSDGRILKWQPNERRWISFAVTSPNREECEAGAEGQEAREHICGRPLGLGFNEETGDMYVADAYKGLLVVGREGGLAHRATAEAPAGVHLRFTNSLDIHRRTGVVFFTDSSSQYRRRDYMSAVVSGDKTGRLLKYDPHSNQTTVLLRNLSFPNGVALSRNAHFLLLAETNTCRILRLWLSTSKLEVFAQLPGFPDNIKRNSKGEFWVGIHSRRGKFLEWILSYPWIGKALLRIPFQPLKLVSVVNEWRGSGFAVRLSEDGEVVGVFGDRGRRIWKAISEVLEEENGNLWIGSVAMPFAGLSKPQI
ncbi:protein STRICTOSIDINE SYNTHASE-LIKE 2-like [Malania oleifera]|uniref:protein STRICTOSIDINE SYNTHASE-LIKE 2-like n=1 Tax=Malania oleifera TaxID=397392 RepID=UPI0025AEB491|nr:protein STRICTOSIDINE SYNTHASE-LIKE 2-like [Malania oleifera]